MGKYATNLSPFEDYNEYSESTQPSCTPSTRSSVCQPHPDAQNAGPEPKLAGEHFKPSTPPERQINAPGSSLPRPGPSGRSSRRSSARIEGSPSPQIAPVDEITAVPPIRQLPPSHLAETTAAPENVVQPATPVHSTTEAEIKRGRRKITTQKYIATGGLIGLKCVFSNDWPIPMGC